MSTTQENSCQRALQHLQGFSSSCSWSVTPEQCPHRTRPAGKVSPFSAHHRQFWDLGFHSLPCSSPLAPHSQITAKAELKTPRVSRLEGVGCAPALPHSSLGSVGMLGARNITGKTNTAGAGVTQHRMG